MTNTATRSPMLHLPAPALLAIHRVLSTDYGPARAAETLRRVGYETGEALFATLQEWLADDQGAAAPATLPVERFWQDLADFFADLGWGRLEYERLHPGVASLSSREWAEADPEARARAPMCHLSTGIFSELLTQTADAETAVLEVECRSRGDEQCRFLIGSPEALEVAYRGLTEGLSYVEALERLG